jgi:hypothetical protein
MIAIVIIAGWRALQKRARVRTSGRAALAQSRQ